MKKKKVVKTIVLIAFILLVCFFLYNALAETRIGNQKITVSTNTKIYTSSSIEAIVDVTDDNSNSISSTLKFELYDANEKKIKDVKTKVKKEEGETVTVSLPLTEDIETGSYSLKITSKTKFGYWKDYVEIPIAIINEENSKIVISLDKGIYKPGDELCYRALLVSSKDNTPVEEDVNVYIYDGNDNKVYSESTKTSEYGIVSGSFQIASEVNSGTYKLVVETEGKQVTKEFTVNPYITPQYEVNIETDKDTYMVGDVATITIDAVYFFGESVSGATVTGTINDVTIEGITDSTGKFTTEYTVLDSDSNINIQVSVVDSSNYLIEAEKTISIDEQFYQIEVLPEYGSLVENVSNDVYIFTKDSSGNPIKTQNTVKVGTISRQVITDDNGIGSFTLTTSDMSEFSGSKTATIQISSKDSTDNVVTYDDVLEVDSGRTLIKTDKVKYDANDDIKITLSSPTDLDSQNIYIYKGDELIKSITTEDGEITVNLEDVTGIVDIYTENNVKTSTSSSSYYKSSSSKSSTTQKYAKKTIFIMPTKELNIAITTDSDVYSPGDTLNINFTTTDEGNNKIDSALLVSILDEAVLELADNDLSIDNIKLALEDIELVDGYTAADLYASVLEESSSSLLTAVLLRQDYTDPDISEVSSSLTSSTLKSEYSTRSWRSFQMIILVIAIFLVVKFIQRLNKKGSSKPAAVLAHIINMVVILICICFVFGESIYDVYYGVFSSKYISMLTFITAFVVTVILYTLVLWKERDYIFRLIITLGALPCIMLLLLLMIGEIFSEELVFVICIILILIWAILIAKNREKKLGNVASFVKNYLTYTLAGIAYIIAMFIVSDFIDSQKIGFVICLAVYIFMDKYVFGKTKIKMKDKKINLNLSVNDLITIIFGVAFILIIVYGLLKIVTGLTGDITDDSSIYTRSSSSGFSFDSVIDSSSKSSSSGYSMQSDSRSITFSDAEEFSAAGISDATEASTSSSGSVFDSISSLIADQTMTATLDADVYEAEDMEMDVAVIDAEVTTTEETVENVRNVFLESLAFIPELVSEDGEASLSLPLSDNITTWNIQTVGNTKEGNIGSSSATFKVFKEFFVDYSLPTNSVVSDKVEIPVTLYNYTEGDLTINVNVVANDWSTIGTYQNQVTVSAGSTNMIYVPLEITKSGTNTLRIETTAGTVSDIVEKSFSVSENGILIDEVVSTGSMDESLTQDIIYSANAIEGTKNLRVKLYTSSMVEVIDNIESILQLPTGCFEQTSSSLYPDILVLKYLEQTDTVNETLKEKALGYIETGYQKLLTYEVDGTKGGYSLYGNDPAEPVITAFGLMEMNDMQEVYEVDQTVISNMKEYLFDQQKSNGSFNYRSTYIGSASSVDTIAMNAYIIWALSEVCPDDGRLQKSIEYLEDNIDDAEDNYTLALMANVFLNVDEKADAKKVINKLLDNVTTNSDGTAYVSSKVKDYYGTTGAYQNIQTTALMSMALTKYNSNEKTNEALINYIISNKKSNSTWGTTQNTILALKAITEYDSSSNVDEQTIKVTVNGEEQSIEVSKDALDVYEFEFENLGEENSITIDMEKGKIYYEIIEEYYQTYDEAKNRLTPKIDVEQTITQVAKVNDTISQNITVTNNSGDTIQNGTIQINIPQGCSVDEESLMMLKYKGIIEKYEYSYGKIYLYVRDFADKEMVYIDITYTALYPETITGGAIRAFDYYNPDVEGICAPLEITVSE